MTSRSTADTDTSSAFLQQQAADVLVACQLAQHQGLTEAFGHISVRGGNTMLITPRQPVCDVRSVGQLVELDLSRPLEVGPTVPPEVHIHAGIYLARPDVNAILRFHGPFELAISTVVDEFRPAIGYGAYVGVVPVHPDPRLVRDAETGARVAATLSDANAVLLRGNGAATVGDSIVEATVRAIFLERSAAATCRAGVTAARPLSDAEIAYFAGIPDARSAQIERAWRYYTSFLAP
jgi:ribulose-5-phosphate 4-epimerase/fuculose-1-phosphate aldolase